MEGYDLISDSYSMEILAVLIVERVWGKIHSYLEDKALDKRLDKMSERIAKLEGKIEK